MNRQQRRQGQRKGRQGAASPRKWLWWTGGGLLGAVAVVVIVLFAAGAFGGGDSADLSRSQVDELVSQSHLIGEPSAPVTLIEFADFQCPFCQEFWDTTRRVLKQEFIDTGEAALYFHNMAFIGPESELAAQAAECAADQGAFESYHDILYVQQGPENQGYLTQARLESFASAIQLDLPAFSSCLSTSKYLAKVRADTETAGDDGVHSTPALAVNGKFVENALDIAEVRQAIQAALDEAS
jgi:protein-disulfide isomerase